MAQVPKSAAYQFVAMNAGQEGASESTTGETAFWMNATFFLEYNTAMKSRADDAGAADRLREQAAAAEAVTGDSTGAHHVSGTPNAVKERKRRGICRTCGTG